MIAQSNVLMIGFVLWLIGLSVGILFIYFGVRHFLDYSDFQAKFKSKRFNVSRADSLFEKGDLKVLSQYCHTYKKDFPNSVHASWYLGVCSFNSGDYVDAKSHFHQVIKINPLWRDAAITYLQEIDLESMDTLSKSYYH